METAEVEELNWCGLSFRDEEEQEEISTEPALQYTYQD
jgi:hypothetical protein